jgi:hypothetical protein
MPVYEMPGEPSAVVAVCPHDELTLDSEGQRCTGCGADFASLPAPLPDSLTEARRCAHRAATPWTRDEEGREVANVAECSTCGLLVTEPDREPWRRVGSDHVGDVASLASYVTVHGVRVYGVPGLSVRESAEVAPRPIVDRPQA